MNLHPSLAAIPAKKKFRRKGSSHESNHGEAFCYVEMYHAGCLRCMRCVRFYDGGCQTQGTTNGSQNAQSSASSGKTAGAVKGEPAPDAPLTMLDGSARSISDFQDSVTIVSFWATWCPYCIKEMPDLQQIRENYPDVNVVMVNCGEDQALVADFVQQQDYDFTWALDPNFEAQMAYPTSGIPYTVVIDPEGNVSEIFAGSGRDMYSRFESAVQQAIG